MMTAATHAYGLADIGRVDSVSNDICIVSGLKNLALNYVVEFSSGIRGIVMGFTSENAQVIILGDYRKVTKGELVRFAEKGLMVNAGRALLGRVINPIGEPLDGLGQIEQGELRFIESPAKPLRDRDYVNRPLYTGFMIIDSQVPIGRGQRELLVGGKKVGIDEVAIEAMINQAKSKSGVVSIYVAIDSETTAIKRKVARLSKAEALGQCVVVVGRSSDPAALNYIAPMVGVSIAESFCGTGQDVLLVFDDLASHARVYRQISLLSNRPAGREAYPGDIFYLHARLLERCGAFGPNAGGGSITALPIVETQNEEITDYITTNLMSITDGHVLFRQQLANKGIQPAVDSSFSVSRIGGRAQTPVMRHLSDELKQALIQYGEMEHYLAFGTELQKEALDVVNLGKRIFQFMNQQYDGGLSADMETALLYFLTSRMVLRWEEDQMQFVRDQIIAFLSQPQWLNQLTMACQMSEYAQAEPILKHLAEAYINDPASLKPIVTKEASIAEKETIIDLLHDTTGSHDAA